MQDLPATNEREPSGRISVLEDANGDGKMDKKSVFAQGLVLPRALKVLDKGVLVAEPPHLWFIPFTSAPGASPTRGREAAGLRLLRHRAGQRRAQRQQPAVGARQLDAHLRGRHLPAAEGRQVRDAQDAVARAVGRVAGRLRPRLPELEQLGAARRPGVDAVLRAPSQPARARAAATSSWAIRAS